LSQSREPSRHEPEKAAGPPAGWKRAFFAAVSTLAFAFLAFLLARRWDGMLASLEGGPRASAASRPATETTQPPTGDSRPRSTP
jgi:hypothetical protein